MAIQKKEKDKSKDDEDEEGDKKEQLLKEFDSETALYKEVDGLKPKQIKFCNLHVFTDLNKKEIADTLDVSASTISNWSQKEEVRNFKTLIKAEVQQDKIRTVKKQNSKLIDLMFADLISRFGTPDQDKIDDISHPADIERYKERFFSALPADKAVNAYQKVFNMIHSIEKSEMIEEEVERQIQGLQPDVVRERREEVENKRKKYKQIKKDSKSDGEDDNTEEVEAFDEDGNKVEAELEDADKDSNNDKRELVEEEEKTIRTEEYEFE